MFVDKVRKSVVAGDHGVEGLVAHWNGPHVRDDTRDVNTLTARFSRGPLDGKR